MSKIPVINTSLSSDSDTLKYEFDNLVATVIKDFFEHRDAEEDSIMND
jgi:hypothetical protein